MALARGLGGFSPSGGGLQPISDEARFDGLVEGLEKASLHNVARAVREERAGLPIPSHAIYGTRLLAGRAEAQAPIYPTPPNSAGSRRCTVAGHLHARPTSAQQENRPVTPSAQYSSPFLLKQFAGELNSFPEASRRTVTADPQQWRAPIDAVANATLYERHRAAGHGWPAGSSPAKPQVLDVAAEQAGAATTPVRAPDADGDFVASYAEEEEEATPPPQPPPPPPPPPPFGDDANTSSGVAAEVAAGRASGAKASSSSIRRCLEMRDAVSYYEAAASRALAPVGRPMTHSASRAASIAAGRSDIFGHSIERGHWSVGPHVTGTHKVEKPNPITG